MVLAVLWAPFCDIWVSFGANWVPFGAMLAFLDAGRPHGLAAARGHGQVTLVVIEVAWGAHTDAPRLRHTIGLKRHLAMTWRRHQAIGTPNNWERPLHSRER